uniref:Uncharacterized protein n=1 Tax=Hyaloperonospora arabidopsidis (strain Emoy2) TaxID=559515 RepID=M4BVT5_HYAAE
MSRTGGSTLKSYFCGLNTMFTLGGECKIAVSELVEAVLPRGRYVLKSGIVHTLTKPICSDNHKCSRFPGCTWSQTNVPNKSSNYLRKIDFFNRNRTSS